MPKVGRNEPCPCGSGKKYKKCCLAKDEAANRLGQSALGANASATLPNEATPATVLSPSLEERILASQRELPPIPVEIAQANERWERFEAADRAEKIRLFREWSAEGVLEYDEAGDMLLEIEELGKSAGEKQEYGALIEEFRKENPATYEEGVGYFQPDLIEDAVEAGAFDRLPALLAPLARASVRYFDTYDGVLTFLLFHGQLRPVVDSMRAAWPTVRDSDEIMQWATDEFASRLLLLTMLDYIESNPAPRFEAPELQASLTVVEDADLPTLRGLFQSIAGEAGEPLRAADFAPALPRRAAERARVIEQTLLPNLSRLTTAWLHHLIHHHGMSPARAFLAYQVLDLYLAKRARNGLTGSTLLLPDRQVLKRHLEAMEGFFDIYGPYRIAPLLKTLPDYLAFLEEHGLASGGQISAARRVVEAIQREYLDTLRAGGWKVVAYLEQPDVPIRNSSVSDSSESQL